MRRSATATACGLKYEKKTRRRGRTFLGWVVMPSPWQTYRDNGAILCTNCIENLELGTGPGK